MEIGDTDLVAMEHLQEVATCRSNGHVFDDVKWSGLLFQNWLLTDKATFRNWQIV